MNRQRGQGLLTCMRIVQMCFPVQFCQVFFFVLLFFLLLRFNRARLHVVVEEVDVY